MSSYHGRTETKPAAQSRPRFKIGDLVAVINTAGATLPKHEERELLEARFEVTRQLPDHQQSFHYRIKDTMTGQERAVTEERLRDVSPSVSPVAEALPVHLESAEHDSRCRQEDAPSSEETRPEGEQANTPSGNEPGSRSLNDNKLSLPKPARPAPARGR